MVCLLGMLYKITGRLVAECIDKGLTLETLPLKATGNYLNFLKMIFTRLSVWKHVLGKGNLSVVLHLNQ